jgi:MYXO-CTERM domain-containing protein
VTHSLRVLSLPLFGALLAWAWVGAPTELTRGPYLQDASDGGITVVCKTSAPAELTLRHGERAGPPWVGEARSPAGTTHVFALTDLRPETRYFYELAAGANVLARAEDCSFRTSPPAASRAPFRFLAWGDSGTGDEVQREVAARMERVLPAPAFALGLGDLVYERGAWQDYDPKLFRPYARLLRSTTFWPALGNHDVLTEGGAPYFDAFHLPAESGAPGRPSGTERFYSFDHGLAHFTCLDSESSDSTPGGAMHAWAEADLADARARGKRWLFVYMHHPPYSRGTHDSTAEPDLIQLHADLVPLFEAQGVDLVMTGHSHVYERSFLARDDAVLQADLAEYSKIGSPDGTVYLVSGCGGRTGSGPLDHPLMARSYGDVAGISVIDVSWSEVRGRFLERDGRTTDLFTLRKAADAAAPRVAAIEARGHAELALVFDEPVQSGAGPGGAEDPARYALGASAAVVSAALDSDQSTVVLETTPLEADRAYVLDVAGVADRGGRPADSRARFVEPGVRDAAAVPRGALWRYFKGTTDPGADWAASSFDDSGWGLGPAGFGFGDGDDATLLTDMRNGYASVYVRAAFDLPDPARVPAMRLGIGFDDGFVAFLNGTEVARANVPLGQTHATLATANREAGGFEPFDLDSALPLLVPGRNVLAVEGHNSALANNDFSLHPELVLTHDAPGTPPRAEITARVLTANAPAALTFSGARSSDPDGEVVTWDWDFGDGRAGATDVEVERVFAAAGRYDVTLVVRDADGLEGLARVAIHVLDEGTAPRAVLAPSATRVATGRAVTFRSAGSRDPDGGALCFHWDFGDPASGPENHSSAAVPVHVYAAAGTYTATLLVTDDEGASTIETATITVVPGGGGSSGGGGACSVSGERDPRGDPLLAAILALALLALLRRGAPQAGLGMVARSVRARDVRERR